MLSQDISVLLNYECYVINHNSVITTRMIPRYPLCPLDVNNTQHSIFSVMRTEFLELVYPCFESLWKFSLRAEWELLDHVTQTHRLCSRRGVTVKGNQRAVRLTIVSLVEDGFIFGTGIQCLWKNISGTSRFQKKKVLFYSSLVTKCGPYGWEIEMYVFKNLRIKF